MNRSAGTAGLVPPGVTTVTSTVPAEPAGEVARSGSESTVKAVAGDVPKYTAAAPVKLVPVISTDVPPATGPGRGVDGADRWAEVAGVGVRRR